MECTSTATRVQVEAKDQDHYLARSDSGTCVTAKGRGRTDHRRIVAVLQQQKNTVQRLQLAALRSAADAMLGILNQRFD